MHQIASGLHTSAEPSVGETMTGEHFCLDLPHLRVANTPAKKKKQKTKKLLI
jgi:hypothetical protein